MRLVMTILFCVAVLSCLAGCAMHDYAERKYSNPSFYPYTYMYYSPYPAPYTYDPVREWNKPGEDTPEERFEGEPK